MNISCYQWQYRHAKMRAEIKWKMKSSYLFGFLLFSVSKVSVATNTFLTNSSILNQYCGNFWNVTCIMKGNIPPPPPPPPPPRVIIIFFFLQYENLLLINRNIAMPILEWRSSEKWKVLICSVFHYFSFQGFGSYKHILDKFFNSESILREFLKRDIYKYISCTPVHNNAYFE